MYRVIQYNIVRSGQRQGQIGKKTVVAEFDSLAEAQAYVGDTGRHFIEWPAEAIKEIYA